MDQNGRNEDLIGRLMKKRQQETDAFKKLLSAMNESTPKQTNKKKRKSTS